MAAKADFRVIVPNDPEYEIFTCAAHLGGVLVDVFPDAALIQQYQKGEDTPDCTLEEPDEDESKFAAIRTTQEHLREAARAIAELPPDSAPDDEERIEDILRSALGELEDFVTTRYGS